MSEAVKEIAIKYGGSDQRSYMKLRLMVLFTNKIDLLHKTKLNISNNYWCGKCINIPVLTWS
jgi:hypothetical protein